MRTCWRSQNAELALIEGCMSQDLQQKSNLYSLYARSRAGTVSLRFHAMLSSFARILTGRCTASYIKLSRRCNVRTQARTEHRSAKTMRLNRQDRVSDPVSLGGLSRKSRRRTPSTTWAQPYVQRPPRAFSGAGYTPQSNTLRLLPA